MNKVGILTYHTGFNYGASLQTYALQTTIIKFGITCEIINFETERFVASREMFSHNPKRLKEIIKIMTRLPHFTELKKRQALFENFTNSCFKLSPLYRTEDQVILHANDYKYIVCGSDQIWNLDEKDSPAANPIFFLNFPKSQKRISYAASFGKWVNKAPKHENIFLIWLKQFDAISVREISGAEYLKSRGIDCELTLDPTLLLDKEDYEPICAPRQIHEKYVLLFSWLCGKEVIAAAKKISKEMGIPLYNIVPPPRAIGKGIRRVLDVGPREFLSMIKYAEFVITDSFHGTAFATIYEKPYISVVSGGKADPRMKSLLIQLGLEKQLLNGNNIGITSALNIDYSNVYKKKVLLRQSSLKFLEKSLLMES